VSISSRTARTVRILGVASASAALALGVADTALACNIRDFSAVASCDGNGKGSITVTDKDFSGQKATIGVYLEENGSDARKVGEQQVTGKKNGAIVTFSENWAANAKYRVHIDVPGFVNNDLDITTPSKACATSETTPSAPASTPPASDTPTPSATPSSSATPSQAQSTAPATTGDNSPSPAAGNSNLAETGASSNTPMIAGIAGGLVVIGGGAVFFGMRRRGSASKSN
jgi:LPXTG-motif cell wall-anchored protein